MSHSPHPARHVGTPSRAARPRGAFLRGLRLLPTLAAAGLLTVVHPCPARATDWPTYAANDARTGVSPDPLPDKPAEAWTWTSPNPPQPAWQGEAKWDGWNKVYNLRPRQIFDRAFHPVVAQGRVYFGSSADDKVYCLDAKTGRELWTHYTDGPVRLAPTIQGTRLYVGSDDGLVYCLDAATGKELWQTRIGPSDRRIPGNGRVISVFPVRTSIIVRDGVLYTTAGMFPSEGIHIVALDAATGKERWRQVQNDLPAQGYLLASRSQLYIPAGRDNPVVCDLKDGHRIRTVDGAGGTYALLVGDSLVFGPGKTGQLGMVEEGASDQLATFQGLHMIVTPDRSYLHGDTEISALDRAKYLGLARQRKTLQNEQGALNKQLRKFGDKPDPTGKREALAKQLADLGPRIDALTVAMQDCLLWKVPCAASHAFILAGTSLVAGGQNEVSGFHADQGNRLWSQPVRGNAYGLAAADGALFVATDAGTLHCLR